MPHIYFILEALSSFDDAFQHEWIITNGLGGYASSTILNVNMRKFHGLLFVAFNPPGNRHLLLSKLDEEVRIGKEVYPLGSNQFKDAIYPEGYRNLRGFEMGLFPTFYYQTRRVYLKKEIFMPHLRNAVVIRYEVFNGLDEPAALRIYPLINMRHFYETTNKGDFQASREEEGEKVLFEFSPKMGYLLLYSTAGTYVDDGDVWIEKIYFRKDDLRGESCLDDCLQPGFFDVDLEPKSRIVFYISASGGDEKEEAVSFYSEFNQEKALEKLYLNEVSRRKKLLEGFYKKRRGIKCEDWLNWLILSADSFIVMGRNAGRKSIIAGYHWFEDWGRDALISLPGLTLAIGRFADAREILLTFAEHSKDGLVPSRFPDKAGGTPEYNSVDSSLWFLNAILQYLKYTGDFGFVYKNLWDTMQDITENYISGTRLGIRMDNDGLILHGPRLTWIDASVEGVPVNPREGKAVEIQALWYNALKIMEVLSFRFGSSGQSENYCSLALRVKKSFNEKFWFLHGDYLYDVVNMSEKDSSFRPNQIIAAYLDFPVVEPTRRERIVEIVLRKLLTPYGLRSLSPDDPRYIGAYLGDFSNRDRAYHNGTVWAWLLGPFTTSFLRMKGYEAYWRRFAFERFLKPLFYVEPFRAGLGSISEIFDGDPPHSPRGCISQAWSVAEPLRAYIEDILFIRPPHEREILEASSRGDKC